MSDFIEYTKKASRITEINDIIGYGLTNHDLNLFFLKLEDFWESFSRFFIEENENVLEKKIFSVGKVFTNSSVPHGFDLYYSGKIFKKRKLSDKQIQKITDRVDQKISFSEEFLKNSKFPLTGEGFLFKEDREGAIEYYKQQESIVLKSFFELDLENFIVQTEK